MNAESIRTAAAQASALARRLASAALILETLDQLGYSEADRAQSPRYAEALKLVSSARPICDVIAARL